MLKRTITGVVAAVLFLPFLIFSHTYAFVILWQAICAISAYELLRCTGLLRRPAVSLPAFLFAAALPMLSRAMPSLPDSSLSALAGRDFFHAAGIFGFLFLFLLLSVSVFSKGKYKISDVMLLFALEFYVTVSLSSIVLLRDEKWGEYFYLLVFITAWGSDIFAYFCGRFFGRHKLIPEVSPQKTVEGAVGGIVCCVGLVLLYGFLVGKFFDLKPNYPALLIAAIVMSLVSMLGDLIMSCVKRHYGIKDYGWIFPGHGGVLDRFDSVLATAPFLFILYTLFPSFALFSA